MDRFFKMAARIARIGKDSDEPSSGLSFSPGEQEEEKPEKDDKQRRADLLHNLQKSGEPGLKSFLKYLSKKKSEIEPDSELKDSVLEKFQNMMSKYGVKESQRKQLIEEHELGWLVS